VSIVLVRSTTVYKPRAGFDIGGQHGGRDDDSDACQTMTITRELADSRLEMGMRGAKGHASAKGWWTGVRPDEEVEFTHCILLPVSSADSDLNMNRRRSN